jgi:hypothetical protein
MACPVLLVFHTLCCRECHLSRRKKKGMSGILPGKNVIKRARAAVPVGMYPKIRELFSNSSTKLVFLVLALVVILFLAAHQRERYAGMAAGDSGSEGEGGPDGDRVLLGVGRVTLYMIYLFVTLVGVLKLVDFYSKC